MRRQEILRGSLLGMAAGDALGYCVEDMTLEEILRSYGPGGIQGYDMINGYVEVSCHTQQAMFTANGLLFGETRGCLRGRMAPYARYAEAALRDWAQTQRFGPRKQPERPCTWLSRVDRMYVRRRPEPLALDALNRTESGTMETPVNYSKSASALSASAAAGLFLRPEQMPRVEIDRLGAEIAALTHGNPLGFLPGAAVTHLICTIAYARPTRLKQAVLGTIGAMERGFGAAYSQMEQLLRLLEKAVQLAEDRRQTPSAAIEQLEPRDAGGVLAAAVFACLRFEGDFESTLTAAVNHSGCSAAVGALAGAIQGAWVGAGRIPEFFLEPLELRDLLEELADDLAQGCPMSADSSLYDDVWDQKYIQCRY